MFFKSQMSSSEYGGNVVMPLIDDFLYYLLESLNDFFIVLQKVNFTNVRLINYVFINP